MARHESPRNLQYRSGGQFTSQGFTGVLEAYKLIPSAIVYNVYKKHFFLHWSDRR